MSEKHLLTCECGIQHPVAIRNAGEIVTCPCNRCLQVPTLRGIQLLPLAPNKVTIRQRSGWTLGLGITYAVTLPLLLTCLGLVGRAEYWRRALPVAALTAPTLQDVLRLHPDPLIQADIDAMAPWQTVNDVWRPFQKITRLVRYTPTHIRAQEMSRSLRRQSKLAGLGAAVCGAIILGTLLLGRR